MLAGFDGAQAAGKGWPERLGGVATDDQGGMTAGEFHRFLHVTPNALDQHEGHGRRDDRGHRTAGTALDNLVLTYARFMSRGAPPFFDQHSEGLDERIATGLHKIGLALKHHTWLRASADGLSPTQGQILAALAMDGPQTGSELARRLGVTLPTVSDSVRVLVAKRLVRRTPDERHPRARRLELTAAGHRLATSARTWPEFLASAAGALSESEQAAFLAALVKMIRMLQEKGQIPVSRMCVTCTHFRPHVHEGPMPHHCAFVDAPMADRHLRLDCREHEEATAATQARAWERFVGSGRAELQSHKHERALRAWRASTGQVLPEKRRTER